MGRKEHKEERMKPVILIGAGCPQSLADKLCQLGIPVLTTWQGIDRVPEDSPVFCGRPGVIGQRAANIIQQKADVIYIFGARMDGEQVGHRMDNFAPNAKKIVYDIDNAELRKLPQDWVLKHRDLNDEKLFFRFENNPEWLKWCRNLYNHFRPELDGENKVEDYVDPYYFTRILSEKCQEGEIIVPASSGMQSCALMQAFKVKRGQKIILCNTAGAMGFEPMAIGAALATDRRVICVCGDGGFYLNVQELEVVKRLNLNIKYFVFCNGGYGSVTTMQDARFNQRVGSDPQSGFTLPDLARVAAVWGFPYHEINSNMQMDTIERVLNSSGAAIVRVNSSLAFRYATKVNSAMHGGEFVVDDMSDMSPKITNLKELMQA
jgi:acetolactate synthase I/II/III large subunit